MTGSTLGEGRGERDQLPTRHLEPRGVVRRRDEDEPRPTGDAALTSHQGRLPSHGADGDTAGVALLRITKEARKRRPRDHDLVARFEDRLADVADSRIGPGGDDDLGGRNAWRSASAATSASDRGRGIGSTRERASSIAASAEGNGPRGPRSAPARHRSVRAAEPDRSAEAPRASAGRTGRRHSRRDEARRICPGTSVGAGSGAGPDRSARDRPASAQRRDGRHRLPVAPVVAATLTPAPPEQAAQRQDRSRRASKRMALRGRRANESPLPRHVPGDGGGPRCESAGAGTTSRSTSSERFDVNSRIEHQVLPPLRR